MYKLDRLGWADGLSINAFGVSAGVRVSDPSALDAVRALLPPGWRRSPRTDVDVLYSLRTGGEGVRRGARNFNLLYRGAGLIARSLMPEDAYNIFESDLRLYVAERATRRVFVHSGVVGWNGRAIIIPGRSFTGKTTLVAELVKAGARYYSDEYAVLDARGHVHPYACPLAMREGGGLRQTRRPVEALGGHAGEKPLPIGLVVVTRYEHGGRWSPRRLTSGEGVLEMLSNTVSARRSPERALTVLSKVADRAVILSGTRGEAPRAAASILKSLGAADRPDEVSSDRAYVRKGSTRDERAIPAVREKV